MHVLISFKSLYKNGLDFKMGNYVKLFACASHLKKNMVYSRLVISTSLISNSRLSRSDYQFLVLT